MKNIFWGLLIWGLLVLALSVVEAAHQAQPSSAQHKIPPLDSEEEAQSKIPPPKPSSDSEEEAAQEQPDYDLSELWNSENYDEPFLSSDDSEDSDEDNFRWWPWSYDKDDLATWNWAEEHYLDRRTDFNVVDGEPSHTPPMPDLPDDVMFEILSRLPRPEDRVRFASVNKRWREIAGNVSFPEHRTIRELQISYGESILPVLEADGRTIFLAFNHHRSGNPSVAYVWAAKAQRFMVLLGLTNPKRWLYDHVRKVVYGLYMSCVPFPESDSDSDSEEN